MAVSKAKTLHAVTFALAVLFCFSYLTPIVSAKEGSIYIDNYSATMYADNNGYVEAWFHITGIGIMDEIGAVSIDIIENGTLVKTYKYTNTPGLLVYNKFIHAGSVTYAGTVGKNYKAYVTYKAGKNGGWDNRGLETNTVTARN